MPYLANNMHIQGYSAEKAKSSKKNLQKDLRVNNQHLKQNLRFLFLSHSNEAKTEANACHKQEVQIKKEDCGFFVDFVVGHDRQSHAISQKS